MTDALLQYYKNELAFIRRMGGEFAEAYPDFAGQLRLSADGSQDPHVERLIQSFALVSARVHRKLDDDFPELTSALFSVLYPHFLCPIPSMAIAQFTLAKDQAELFAGYPLPARTALETEPVDGAVCQYRTCFPVRLFPMEVTAASLGGLPLGVSTAISQRGATALLKIDLSTYAPGVSFDKLKLPALRFHIKGQDQHVFALYELLMNHSVCAAVSATTPRSEPTILPDGAIQPVGFSAEEGILPWPPRSVLAYRLLTEYFAFPKKFLFFDVAIPPELLKGKGSKVSLQIYLNRSAAELEKAVSIDTFRLGATPIVNLFQQPCEPIRLTQQVSEYRVVPSARDAKSFEVYSIDEVTCTSARSSQVTTFQPFYHVKHDSPSAQTPYWFAGRQESVRDIGGSETFISLVDLQSRGTAPADSALHVMATCMNRDLPNRLVFGGGRPIMQLADRGPIARVECLTKPTDTLRRPFNRGVPWRLFSHLSLNHLSIAPPDGDAEPLREILRLYDLADSEETRLRINSILSVTSRRKIGRAGGANVGGVCRGTEIEVKFDESRFGGVYLLASVLERFFAFYCNINSFTQLTALSQQREKELRRWPPRAGERVLL